MQPIIVCDHCDLTCFCISVEIGHNFCMPAPRDLKQNL